MLVEYMEIATEIIRVRNKYKIVDFVKFIRAFKLSRFVRNYSSKQFLQKVRNNNIVDKIDHEAKKVFFIKDNFGYNVVMAYYFVGYTPEVFDSYKTRFENRLIKASFSLVYQIEHSHNDTIEKQFCRSIDRYNSLFLLWMKEDKMETVDNIVCNIKDVVTLCKVSKKLNKNKLIKREKCNKRLEKLIEELLDVDPMIALKTIFENYCLFYDVSEIYNKVWKYTKGLTKKNLEQTLLIILAELRVLMLAKAPDANCKKTIYYKVDLEEAVDNIQMGKFYPDYIVGIISVLAKCCKADIKIVSNPKWENDILDTILRNLQIIYEKVCDCHK